MERIFHLPVGELVLRRVGVFHIADLSGSLGHGGSNAGVLRA